MATLQYRAGQRSMAYGLDNGRDGVRRQTPPLDMGGDEVVVLLELICGSKL